MLPFLCMRLCSGLICHSLKAKILTMLFSLFTPSPPISITPCLPSHSNDINFFVISLTCQVWSFPSALSTINYNIEQTMIITYISTLLVDNWQKSSSNKNGNLSFCNLEALWVNLGRYRSTENLFSSFIFVFLCVSIIVIRLFSCCSKNGCMALCSSRPHHPFG